MSTKESSNTIFDSPLRAFTLGSVVMEVAIADTQQARRQGLSHITVLSPENGLFFVFPESGIHGIWMKDMKFSIDVIWLNEKLEVVDINRDISPDTYPTSFHPQTPARFALEVNAGVSLKFDVKIGSVGTFKTL
ncbi:DUF192 domain-containing protein [Candidatus Kaiserbacteria bacterium]|nr:DUF192 domain-containing protein [Candidatus Kaiserbacteria bacterium]